jgi:DNA (cytosine-5)-methyltransferase 1
VLDVLSKNVPSKYYLSEKIKPTILADGSKNFISKSEINPLIARPLTATMVKMHRACQDNYYSDNFLNAENPISFSKQFFTKEELRHQKIRKITPEEAFALQGFDNVFYQNAVNAGLSDHQLYKQAGNAVSVNTVYAILYYLFIHKQLLDSSNYAANKQKTLVTSRYGLTLSF